jgi:hypothetical protein
MRSVSLRGLSRRHCAGMHGSSPCMTMQDPRGVVQRVLPGLEPGIQEARGGDEIGQPSWIISPPLRRDARVKPVHDDLDQVRGRP